MKTATFDLYTSGGVLEEELYARNGERVEVLRRVELAPDEPVMWHVRFPDGFECDAFGHELSEWSAA